MTETTNEHQDDRLDALARGEASTALKYRAIRFELQGDSVVPVLDTGESIAADAAHITDCVREIIKTEGVLFELVPRRRVLGTVEYVPAVMIKATKLGERFLQCLRMDVDRITDLYAIEDFNPYFRLFRQAAMQGAVDRGEVYCVDAWSGSVLGEYARRHPLSVDGQLEDFAERLGNAVEMIKKQGRSQSFRQEKWAFEKPAGENYDSLVALIRANFAACHHLLILRIDLGYAQYYCDPALSGEQAVSYVDVRRHRHALIRFIKRRLPKGAYRGYALKLEFGLDKTYHYHVLVLLNGDVVREAATISKLIGDYWKQYITEGKGGAYNCNAATYKESGIGSVRYFDEKRAILETVVAAYLTKVDFYIRMTKPDAHRAFWKSLPPKVRPKRSGRKRGKEDASPPARSSAQLSE
ncbi:inovirus-type Gp2 protein [Ralstonia solanacearum]|uniref:Inovirus Gp2 family protein n=1 Tax=Ralstonia solanacearum TaxID=305 RepID=A0AAE3NLQ4_RALSL|nr:inovirus-type Gp2 protein [Ralstonia solanacearum]MBB6580913.1 inovirus-type Gp2 protein [Ralstonia solanacearum]MDB0524280.1 inovirus Gp2 family protein [Ralstonia solanacearum]